MTQDVPEIITTDMPTGRRCWWVDDDCDDEYEAQLFSTVIHYPWDGPVCMNDKPPAKNPWEGVDDHKAKNFRWRGPKQGRSDRWGFYSFRLDVNRDHLLKYMFQVSKSDLSIKCVGHVGLMGTVWQHELGYRSQGVRVERLALFHSVDMKYDEDRIAKIIESLENRYRCDVDVFRDSRIGS